MVGQYHWFERCHSLLRFLLAFLYEHHFAACIFAASKLQQHLQITINKRQRLSTGRIRQIERLTASI